MLPKILLGVGLFATLFSVLIFSCKIPVGKCKPGNKPLGDVYIWGTLPEATMAKITQEFNPKAKTYRANYKYVPEADFEQVLLEAIASGKGPDMIMVPHQIILSQAERIYPLRTPEKNFRDEYVDGASVLFTSQGALALPFSIEPMVLFFNRTLFSKHGIINPPTYWDEVTTLVPALTVRQNGQFLESAIALGTPNVPYAKDIIMTIVAQLGQTPVAQGVTPEGELYYSVQANEPISPPSNDPTAQNSNTILPLVTVNRYFTQFGDPGQPAYTWSQSQTGNAADLFVGEKVAMYIGYSGEYQTLRTRNPRGDFQMTTLPQTRGYNTFSTGMRMYAIATLRTSKNLVASQTVQVDFASAGISPTLAELTGGVSPLRANAANPALDPVVARGMLVAHGWYDKYTKQSTAYTASMISDIINLRYGVNDATTVFISRMRDLYSKKY